MSSLVNNTLTYYTFACDKDSSPTGREDPSGFLVESYGLRLRGVDALPSHFTLSCTLFQCTLAGHGLKAEDINTSSAKSRDKTMRFSQ